MTQGPTRIREGFLTSSQVWTQGRSCQESIGMRLVEEGGEKNHRRRKVGVRVRATDCLAGLGQMKGLSV